MPRAGSEFKDITLHVGEFWLGPLSEPTPQQVDNVCRWQVRTYFLGYHEVPELFGALDRDGLVRAKNCARLARF